MATSIYLSGVLSMGILGVILALGLIVAARFLSVEVDLRVEKAIEILPGANCGACGYPGCQGFAEALAAGEALPDGCPVCADTVTKALAEIMGMESSETKERLVAHVLCNGGIEYAKNRADYQGVATCMASQALGNGHKSCVYGCLGFGDCVTVCPFGAASMGEDGIPRFDPEKCTGCGKCVEACPRNLVKLVGVSKRNHIRCSTHMPAREIRGVCSVGCIGCQRCVKVCPENAISMQGRLAVIDYDKCTNCGECHKVCPTKAIEFIEEDKWVKA